MIIVEAKNMVVTLLVILSIFFLFTLLFLLFCCLSLAKADHIEPVSRVNQNEQTDLFYRATGNWLQLQKDITGQKDEILKNIKTHEGLDNLAVGDAGVNEIKKEANNLSSIRAMDLNSLGTEKMLQDKTLDNLYVNYNSPLHRKDFADAKKIANAQNSLLGNLLSKLQEIGVNCRTTRGSVEKEPAYYLGIKKDKYLETIYDNKTCREVRNKYDCTDSLSLKCLRRGMKWDNWEYRTIILDGAWVYWNWRGWLKGLKHSKGRFDNHMRRFNHVVDIQVREEIIKRLGVKPEQISPNLNISERGEGNMYWIENKSMIWERFRIGYHYRDGQEICEQWEETWTERCRITAPDRSVANYRKIGKRAKK